MNIERLEMIEWFVEFAQMDIDALKASDQAKLVIDVKEYLFPEAEIKKITENLKIIMPEHIEEDEKLKKAILIQEEVLAKTRDEKTKFFLKENVEYLKDQYSRYCFGTIKSVLDSYEENPKEYWDMVKIAKRLLHDILEQIMALGSDHASTIEDEEQDLLEEAHIVVKILSVVDGEFNYRDIPLTDSLYRYIETKVYSLVSGFRATAIRRCIECKKIFFDPSLRDKKFCSARCQSRFHSAKGRRAERNKKKKGNL